MAKPLSFAIVKGDRRHEILCRLLERDGHSGRIIPDVGEKALALERHEIVVALRLGEGERFALRQNGVAWVEYGNEGYLTANAVITAENALQVAMEQLERTLNGSYVLVMGYGRIGKALAPMLRGLGCHVTVAAWKPEELAAARGLGLGSLHTQSLVSALSVFDVIFNTVPHVLLDSNRLKHTKDEALIIDLASLPGGVDFPSAAELGRKAVHELALPGRLTPFSAAEAIRDAIYAALSNFL